MKQSVSVRAPKVKATVTALNEDTVAKVVSLAKPRLLLAWYDRYRRVMPWRALPNMTPNPYHVWLSEIMLQQTTVATVGEYFRKFIKRWPKLNDLAAADLNEVMQMWAGLGYYRRARLLHECAQVLSKKYQGKFPQHEAELLQLPGFGPYTAAAVRAIAFDQRANVVDGNVERVVARLFAIHEPMPKAKKLLRELAAKLLPSKRYGDYAQALMDLGATICTPRKPKCALCPWNVACEAHLHNIAEQFPQRIRTGVRPVRRAIAFVLSNKDKEIFLRQRSEHGLLGGMMEVPSSMWREEAMPDIETVLDEAPIEANWILRPGLVRHVFSHFELQIAVATAVSVRLLKSGKWVAFNKLENEALPSLMHKIIRHSQEWL